LKLKSQFYLLTLLLHGFLLVSAYFFVGENKLIFVAVEAVLITSLIIFLKLIKKSLAPFELIDLFSEILNEQEFTTRFSLSGNKEFDNLMSLFNQMLSQLYDERLRLGDRKGMLQQLLDAIPLSIIVFDYDNKVSQLNPAAESLLNCLNESIKGKAIHHIEHSLVENLSLLKNNVSLLVSDNKGRRYRCQKNIFRDRGFDRQFIIIQEITSELQLSERKTYEKLIRMMSHEVNNTMAATSSLLESCLHYSSQIEASAREDYRNALQLVIKRTNNLNQFMQAYATIVRLPKPVLESCNLGHLLLSMSRLFESQLLQKNIRFVIEKGDAVETQINADQNQLEQVLINIIKNAIESVNKNGWIKVSFALEQGNLCVKISDSGAGINPASQQDLFTPFFTTKSDGQGIGLMLVREILEAHGFDYSLYNLSDGGACFEIVFS
jgi:two-component system, NtrC family, nitrogen regulation sensor histidine kinase NtrY